MQMTNEEIVRDYNAAKNKSKQIKVLADLNQTSPSEIRAILADAGVEGVAAPARVAPRRSPPLGRAEARPQGSESRARQRLQECPAEKQEAVPAPSGLPEVYSRIETILAMLPEDASEHVRSATAGLTVALFSEYVDQRMRKEGTK